MNMKKIVLAGALVLMSVLSLQTSFAGGEYAADAMMYPYGENSVFTLESMMDATRNRSVQTILKSHFDMISQNTSYENYEHNSKHFYTKMMDYSIFIPKDLSGRVSKAALKITRSDYGPIMYDTSVDAMAKDAMTTSAAKVASQSIDIPLIKDTENLSGSLTLNRDIFETMIVQEYGDSFTAQVELTLTDGSVIPYSQVAYLYMQADNAEGKKAHLSNLYYTQNPYMGYPDVAGLLKSAYAKLEAKSKTVADYLATLEKVSKKASELAQTYTASLDGLVTDIDSEEDFAAQVDAYGTMMQKANILNDASYQIGSEIQTRKHSGVIDELFQDF